MCWATTPVLIASFPNDLNFQSDQIRPAMRSYIRDLEFLFAHSWDALLREQLGLKCLPDLPSNFKWLVALIRRQGLLFSEGCDPKFEFYFAY